MSVKLKYIAKNGAYIIMIPSRDLTDLDLETIAVRDSVEVDMLISQLIGSGLYRQPNKTEKYICAECGKSFKSWQALNKHEIRHIKELAEVTEKEEDNDNSINST